MAELDIVLVANDPDVTETRILNSKTVGPHGRSIPFIEQIDVCWKSIFANWDPRKISFQAWQLHTVPLGERMKAMLKPYEEMGLRVLQVPPVPYHPAGLAYNRAVAFVCDELKANQRMIIDADIVCLGTPPIDLNVAAGVMWAGAAKSQAAKGQLGVVYRACGIPYTPSLYVQDFNIQPHIAYHLGDNRRNFEALFNMGCFTLRRDICRPFFDRFVKFVPALFHDKGGRSYGFQWMCPQFAMSAAIVTSTLDWHLLPRGVNFLPVLMPSKQAIEAGVKITLYHYANNNERGLEPVFCGEWFAEVPHYARPDELCKPMGLPGGKLPEAKKQ